MIMTTGSVMVSGIPIRLSTLAPSPTSGVAELVRNAGHTVSKERLLSSVWGYHFDSGSNVVDVYVRRVRAKLGKDVITTVRGVGYVIRG